MHHTTADNKYPVSEPADSTETRYTSQTLWPWFISLSHKYKRYVESNQVWIYYCSSYLRERYLHSSCSVGCLDIMFPVYLDCTTC